MSFDFSMLDPALIENYEAMGIDTAAFAEFLAQCPPDAITGEVGPEEMVRYIMRNADNPFVQNIGKSARTAIKDRTEAYDDDFSTFDFSTLASTIPDNDGPPWVVTLERFAFVDPAGNFVLQEDAAAIPGVLPKFLLSCEHASIIRAMEEVTGLPDSRAVLRFIKRAMVTPLPGILPGMPRVLHISIKLQQHRSALEPFLNSLPAPFHWEIQTPVVAGAMDELIDVRMQIKYKGYMDLAEQAKLAANNAFKAKDRATALKKYTEAIDLVLDANMQRPSIERRTAADQLHAICLGNRAATYLMEGEGQDVAKALEDAKKAEIYDADYGKGYYRQAKALVALGEVGQAQDALRRALARPALATDKALLSLLNELDIQLD